MSPVFAELQQLETIIQRLGNQAQTEVLTRIGYQDRSLPVYSISIGSQRDDVPVIAYFGGVHGLEKIGTEVLLAYLQTLANILLIDFALSKAVSADNVLEQLRRFLK